MIKKEYTLYFDESQKNGKFFGNFYGGALVNSKDIDYINATLNAKKQELNLFGEIKWSKVTEEYLDKYKEMITTYFNFIKENKIKIRIMFKPTCFVCNNLSDNQIDNEYYLLYYQFVKLAFGFEYCNPKNEIVNFRFYFDKLPNTPNRNMTFINYIYGLNNLPMFTNNNLHVKSEDITEVISHNHVILQCMDIILGSINFKLNELNKIKDPITHKRGKKTKAKENLYKHILSNIRDIFPNFNIGISTGIKDNWANKWLHPYRHWKFIPNDSIYEPKFTKRFLKK